MLSLVKLFVISILSTVVFCLCAYWLTENNNMYVICYAMTITIMLSVILGIMV